jgi:tetratricopeptide (TPR) repeat protein
LAKALARRQQIGDRAGEATTWAQLGYVEYAEGNYPQARQHYQKALAMLQQIGDRAGEAANWHNLASLDLEEGSYLAARDKFSRALAMLQQIGDRAGEAGTFYQLGMLATQTGQAAAGARLVALCFLLRQAIGHGKAQNDLKNLLHLSAQLGYDEPQVQALLQEVAESYRQDHGRALLRQAFPDAQPPPEPGT